MRKPNMSQKFLKNRGRVTKQSVSVVGFLLLDMYKYNYIAIKSCKVSLKKLLYTGRVFS